MKLHEALSQMTVPSLKSLYDTLAIPGHATRKADLVDAITAYLLSDALKSVWERLSELEANAVAEALHNWGGFFDAVRFNAKYGSLPSHFTTRVNYSYGRSMDKVRSLLSGVFFSREIPEDLAARLLPIAPKPSPFKTATFTDEQLPESVETGGNAQETEPLRRFATEGMVRQDLPAVLRLIAEGGVAVGAKTGIPSAASVVKLESMLLGGDWYSAEDDQNRPRLAGGPIRPIRPFAWPLLLQVGGLAKLDGGSKLALTARGKKALSQPMHEVVAHLHECWVRKGAPDELRRVDLIKGQTSKGLKLTPPAGRRQAIDHALAAGCAVGRWVSVDDFFRQIKVQGELFQVSHNPWKLYFSDQNYGRLSEGGGDLFEVLQARYALVYLFEYLATLGLIDVAYSRPYHARRDYGRYWGVDDFSFLSRYDGLRYLRLNALGAFCLGLTDSYQERVEVKPPLFQFDADLGLTLLRAPDPAERLQLELIATRLSPGPVPAQASDQASDPWRLKPEAILTRSADADERGRIRRFIESSSQGAVPVEVRQLLDSVEERASAFVDIGPARLIQCRDAALAILLSTDPATAAHCSRAGERLLCVPEKKLAPFRKGVSKLGFVLPEVQGG